MSKILCAAGIGEPEGLPEGLLDESLEQNFCAYFSHSSLEFLRYRLLKDAGVDGAILRAFLKDSVDRIPILKAAEELRLLREEISLREGFASIKKQLEAYKEKIPQILLSKSRLQAEVRVLGGSAAVHERQLKDMFDPELMALRGKLGSCEEEIQRIVQSKTALNQDKSGLEKEKEALQKQLASLQKSLEDSLAGTAGRLGKLQKAISKKEVELTQMMKTLVELKEQARIAEQSLAPLPRQALLISKSSGAGGEAEAEVMP